MSRRHLALLAPLFALLLAALLWQPRLVFPWSQRALPAARWPAHAARGPPRFSIVR